MTDAAINDALSGEDNSLTTPEKNIHRAQRRDRQDPDRDRWSAEGVKTKLLKLARSKTGCEGVAEIIYRLREQMQKAQVENASRAELRKRMADMKALLREQRISVTEYGEKPPRRLIEKVAVYENRFTAEFKPEKDEKERSALYGVRLYSLGN